MKDSPIIVTEIPRSGASMIAHVLHVCGAWCAPTGDWPAKIEEEGGNRHIRDTVVRPIFKGMKADMLGLRDFPSIEECKATAPQIETVWRRQVIAAMEAQGYESNKGAPWVYRGSDALLVWPLWTAAFPEARWVIARREDKGIIRSCFKAGYMNASKTEDEWQVWIDEYKSRLAGLNETGAQVLQAWPGRFIGGKMDDLQRLVRSLSLEWDSRVVEDALAPVLWTHGQYSVEGVK